MPRPAALLVALLASVAAAQQSINVGLGGKPPKNQRPAGPVKPNENFPWRDPFTAGDAAWISPFHEQDSVTVSVSGEPGRDYWDYLRAVDKILRSYGSRPHWGKLHFLTGEDVSAIYPRAQDFRALRRKLDPQGVYLNDHLTQLFR